MEVVVGLPAIIKPVNEGSSIGITVAHSPDQVLDGINHALRYDHRVLVEEFVTGLEVTCGGTG